MSALKRLSQDQIDEYWRNGFVNVGRVLSDDEIAAYKARGREVVLGDYPPEAENRVMWDVRIAKGLVDKPEDPEHAIWKLFNPDRFDAALGRFKFTPALLDAVEDIIGHDIIAFLLMMIWKPPAATGIEAVHHFHQDAFYFPFGPHDRILAAWVPLDDASEANGGLTVIPGSHRWNVKTHKLPEGVENALTFCVDDVADHPEAVSPEVKAGDAILFHSHLFHKTGANRTDGHRRVLTMHAASAKCSMETPLEHDEFGMSLVRGRSYDGCLNVGDLADPAEVAMRRPSAEQY